MVLKSKKITYLYKNRTKKKKNIVKRTTTTTIEKPPQDKVKTVKISNCKK